MAVVFERVKAGDILYEVKRERAGNTRMSRVAVRTVRILSIDHEKNEAVVSWNGNSPITWSRSLIRKLRRSPPKTA